MIKKVERLMVRDPRPQHRYITKYGSTWMTVILHYAHTFEMNSPSTSHQPFLYIHLQDSRQPDQIVNSHCDHMTSHDVIISNDVITSIHSSSHVSYSFSNIISAHCSGCVVYGPSAMAAT